MNGKLVKTNNNFSERANSPSVGNSGAFFGFCLAFSAAEAGGLTVVVCPLTVDSGVSSAGPIILLLEALETAEEMRPVLGRMSAEIAGLSYFPV